MPGIIVGTDGSAHSRRALEWAIWEAGIRRTPLTVFTVYQAIPDYWGTVTSPGAHALAAEARTSWCILARPQPPQKEDQPPCFGGTRTLTPRPLPM